MDNVQPLALLYLWFYVVAWGPAELEGKGAMPVELKHRD